MEIAITNEVITGIEFTSVDGEIQWRPTFNGRVGVWSNTGVQTNNPMGFLTIKNELLRAHGLPENDNATVS
ncbi:MAG: hypothetical protein EXS46_00355 [Candidatus Taylorbacteria bacterium]|nr:hypothetical protein [Candidatus Taylorbacteria bacterium]